MSLPQIGDHIETEQGRKGTIQGWAIETKSPTIEDLSSNFKKTSRRKAFLSPKGFAVVCEESDKYFRNPLYVQIGYFKILPAPMLMPEDLKEIKTLEE